ncbi:hypothetical protein ONS95_005696 [Cadophora gregata]|uniref:uncharacterized protein n=1 Tax=Cadophora gregata TaxID=51156 RepID=UPI0026DD523A|nr:uncharacterized protein ONS95_005696 [Cadophora gregata]KAK0103686.1 hypothetical protein ONS95_005696 [Cadophora gregata]KAK0107876.1 hypothetical protein ONS96_003665 [Cadophora gregata f. sp. sojae]
MYVTRACDCCKRRKVKCDSADPCASCQTSRIPCRYTIIPQKRGRASQRPAASLSLPSSPTTPQSSTSSDAAAAINSAAWSNSPSNSQSIIIVDSTATSHPPLSPHEAGTGTVALSIPISPAADEPSSAATRILTNLVQQVDCLLTKENTAQLVTKCVDLFMMFLFPNTPVCHEPTLRAGISIFQLRTIMSSPADTVESSLVAQQPEALLQLGMEKHFTLLTALCALVLSVAPESYIPQKAVLALLFLKASRAMLQAYQEIDLESPDWTSLIIRVWQSSATQNATGRNGEANHYYGEAEMLALRLRLYDESSVIRESTIESQLLRSIFWLLYLSDKSATALDDRLCIINERVFDGELTLLERGNEEVPLLDMKKTINLSPLENQVQEGFVLKRHITSAAVDIITALKPSRRIQAHLSSQCQTEAAVGEVHGTNASKLTDLYLEFACLIDSFPRWLRSPDQYLDRFPDADGAHYQKMCFWAQRSSIMTTFHSLKLVILQKCIDHGAPEVMGLDHNKFSQHLKKIDLARDFLAELQLAPFQCIKMQGEPAVQRLRKVGSIILEVVHNASNESIKTRAQSQLVQLLDVLAQLDSKASDGLRGQ